MRNGEEDEIFSVKIKEEIMDFGKVLLEEAQVATHVNYGSNCPVKSRATSPKCDKMDK